MKVTVYEASGTIGGGTRTSELTVPGLLHDHCSAVHPMGVASPAFQELDLASHGLEWLWPEVDMAHPLSGGRAGVVHRSLTTTAAGSVVTSRLAAGSADRPPPSTASGTRSSGR